MTRRRAGTRFRHDRRQRLFRENGDAEAPPAAVTCFSRWGREPGAFLVAGSTAGKVNAGAALLDVVPWRRMIRRVNPALAEQLLHNHAAMTALAEEFGLLPPDAVRLPERSGSARQVFTVRTRAGVDMYPAFQFSAAAAPRPVVAQVLAAFGDRLSDAEIALWWTSSNDWLGGLRPVDLLECPDESQIVTAAQRLADEILA